MPLNSKAKGSAGETWMPVVGYEGVYEVSNLGAVRRVSKAIQYEAGRPVVCRQHPNGYVYVCLSKFGKKRTIRHHKIVAEAFLGPRPSGMQVNHRDGNKANNCIGNLEYCSQSENMRHAYDNNLQEPKFGEDIHSAKLDERKVRQIVAMESDFTHHQIASMYGVTRKTVAAIFSGRTWSRVTGRDYSKRNRTLGAPRRNCANQQ